jgi:NAD(P)-dependent dehydrogenase (short-subunit alcohol dehydrogenase family)
VFLVKDAQCGRDDAARQDVHEAGLRDSVWRQPLGWVCIHVGETSHYLRSVTFARQPLLPLLIKTPESRLVVVSSSAHTFSSGIDLDDVLKRDRAYSAFTVYGDSKLANLLFARELHKRLTGKPAPLITTSHPGYTATELQRSSNFAYLNALAMSPPLGSLTQVRSLREAAAGVSATACAGACGR